MLVNPSDQSLLGLNVHPGLTAVGYPKHDNICEKLKLNLRDWNQSREDNTRYEDVVERHELWEGNEDDQSFVNLCAFPHKYTQRTKWVSSDHSIEDQTGYLWITKNTQKVHRGSENKESSLNVFRSLPGCGLLVALDRIEERKNKKIATNNSWTRTEKTKA